MIPLSIRFIALALILLQLSHLALQDLPIGTRVPRSREGTSLARMRVKTELSLVDWYVTAKRLAGRSDKTLSLAARAVSDFDASLDKPLEDATRDDVIAFLTEYRKSHADSTTATTRAYLASFWHWLVAEGIVQDDIMRRVPITKIRETEPHIVSDAEFQAMLRVTYGTSFRARRDTAILRLLESSGCRRNEIGMACVDDLDLSQLTLRVVGKGNRPRLAPLDDATSIALRHYLRLRARHKNAHLSRLFIGGFGALSGDAIGDVVTTAARRAGLSGVTAHAFRHRFGDNMKKAGMSEESLRSLGGWSSQTYLERYGRANRTLRAMDEYQGLRRKR